MGTARNLAPVQFQPKPKGNPILYTFLSTACNNGKFSDIPAMLYQLALSGTCSAAALYHSAWHLP